MRSQDKQDEQGFTLVEIMVATAVTSVIVLAGMSALTMTGKAVRANEQISDAQQNARMAMEMITHDIKMAGFGPPLIHQRIRPQSGTVELAGFQCRFFRGITIQPSESLILDRIKSRSWCPSRFMARRLLRRGRPPLHLV